jgi:hypothetical protein
MHVNGGHRKHLEQLDAIAVKDDKVGFYRMSEKSLLTGGQHVEEGEQVLIEEDRVLV